MVRRSTSSGEPANLKWRIQMERAKAGLGSRMAVPKRVAQKAKQRLKRQHNGAVPEVSAAALGTIEALERARAERQRHHRVKLLQQAVKKAKDAWFRAAVVTQ